MGRLTFLGERLAASSPFAVHHALNGYRNPVISPETRFPGRASAPTVAILFTIAIDGSPDSRNPAQPALSAMSWVRSRDFGPASSWVRSRSFEVAPEAPRRIDSFRNVVGSFARFSIRGYRGFVRARLVHGSSWVRSPDTSLQPR